MTFVNTLPGAKHVHSNRSLREHANKQCTESYSCNSEWQHVAVLLLTRPLPFSQERHPTGSKLGMQHSGIRRCLLDLPRRWPAAEQWRPSTSTSSSYSSINICCRLFMTIPSTLVRPTQALLLVELLLVMLVPELEIFRRYHLPQWLISL
jgi:hypothetical protein